VFLIGLIQLRATADLFFDTPSDPSVVDGIQELVALVHKLAEKVNSAWSQNGTNLPQDMELSVSDSLHIGLHYFAICVFNGISNARVCPLIASHKVCCLITKFENGEISVEEGQDHQVAVSALQLTRPQPLNSSFFLL